MGPPGGHHVADALIFKLERYIRLSGPDKEALRDATRRRLRHADPRQDLFREGDAPAAVNVMLSGWACCYKQLEDGRRQITGFLLPGDLSDFSTLVSREMDHSVAALTSVTIAELTHDVVDGLLRHRPRLMEALRWNTAVAAATQREWIVSLGQRDAFERVGHLLCELFMRLQSVGLAQDGTCELPVVQTDLADATGLSAVHVNRTLQELRSAGLIVLKGRTLHIPNLAALQEASLFNPAYLHLDNEGNGSHANGATRA